MRAAALIGALGLALLGCASETPPQTLVVVRIDAAPEVRRAMRALNLRIFRHQTGNTWESLLARGWEADRLAWPAELTLVPADVDMPRHFEVVAEAHSGGGDLLAGTAAISTFAEGQITALGLYLELDCFMLKPECEPPVSSSMQYCHGERCKTCRGGRCVETRTWELPAYVPEEGVRDLFERSQKLTGRPIGAGP